VEAVRLVTGGLTPIVRLVTEVGAGGVAYVLAAGLMGHRRIVDDARAFAHAHASQTS
jgi:hypothetical protein